MGTEKTFLFSVDVEDWFQVENFKSTIAYESWSSRQLRVEQNTHRLLDLLDDTSLSQSSFGAPKATFFILGWIAERIPALVKEISVRGHEIASHGMNHRLCTQESTEALKSDLEQSKKLLEELTGSPVNGYRAPSFSLSNDILKIIENTGYQYDSSYNSFDKHGRYGAMSTLNFKKKQIALKVSDGFWELPISNLSIPIQQSTLNIEHLILPWGGGGYFRLFPYFVFRKGIRTILKKESAYSFYIHPWELDLGQPRVENAPKSLKLRHYVNLKSTARKIKHMLDDFKDCRFVTCREYLEIVATDQQ